MKPVSSYPYLPRLCVLALLAWLMLPVTGMAQAPEPKPMEYKLDAGAMIPAMLHEPISTETSVQGQTIRAAVAQDMFLGTRKILSRNDRLLGRITVLEPPIQGRNAILKIEFDTLALASGIQIPLVGLVDTGQESHAWGGELTPGTKAEVIPVNVYRVGTYGRVMYHGPRMIGTHVKLLPGTRFVVVLQAPVRLYGF